MKLYVGNLNERTAEIDLRNLFSTVGDLLNVNIIKDRYSGNSRGFGFVEFENQSLGQTAISKFNGQMVDGVRITVSEAIEKFRPDRSKK